MNNRLLNIAESGGGTLGFIFAGITVILFVTLFFIKISKNDYLASFLLIIIFLPVTYYSTRIFGVVAYIDYTTSPPFVQYIGLTSLFIFIQFIMMKINGSIIHHEFAAYRIIKKLLWLFSISITITQFFSHEPISAILLSIGASWQYLLLFYIFTSLISDEKSLIKFLKSVISFSIVNKLFIIIVKGEPLIKPILGYTEKTAREGNIGALGPPVSAAIYLVIFFTLGLGLYYYLLEKKYLLYLLFIIIEIFSTFTRGAIFVLFLTMLPMVFLGSRRIVKIVIGFSLLTLPFWNILWKYITLRGFSFDVTQVDNFTARLEFIYIYFNDYYHFSLVGNGLVKSTIIYYTSYFSPRLHNVYFEVLDVAGIINFILIIIITFVVLRYLIKYSNFLSKQSKKDRLIKVITPFFLTAFIQWVIYANTTSTSILYYYPYEGTLFFWILCFTPIITLVILAKTKGENQVNLYENSVYNRENVQYLV